MLIKSLRRDRDTYPTTHTTRTGQQYAHLLYRWPTEFQTSYVTLIEKTINTSLTPFQINHKQPKEPKDQCICAKESLVRRVFAIVYSVHFCLLLCMKLITSCKVTLVSCLSLYDTSLFCSSEFVTHQHNSTADISV